MSNGERTAAHLRLVIPPAPWTQAVIDGAVRVDGLTWECIGDIDNAPDRFVATSKEGADVGENGVRRYVIGLLDGASRCALPVFFGREHMQRNLIVRNDGSIQHPKDLEGKTVGSRLTIVSGTGAAVLMMLELAYDVDLSRVRYRMGNPGSLPRNPMGLTVERGPGTDNEAFEALRRGALDAVVVTTGPRYFSLFGGDKLDAQLRRFPDLRPLLDDPEVIAQTYRRTGLCPISDLVVVSPRVFGRPGLARKVVDTLSQANGLASRYREPAEERLAQREIELLGEDPHVYGLGPNQTKNVDAFVGFLHRLGAIERTIPAAELFAAF